MTPETTISPETEPVEIKVVQVDSLGDPIETCNVISAIFANGIVFCAGINTSYLDDSHIHIEHTRIQYITKVPEKDIVGGIVIKKDGTNLRISHGSGSYEDRLPRPEINRYKNALMEKLNDIFQS